MVFDRINISDQEITLVNMLFVLAALLGSTFATLYQKRFASHISLLPATLVQYCAAALAYILLALLFEDNTIQWTGQFIFALIWLIIVLSLGAVAILMYLIKLNSAASVSSLMYLVPPATAIEAYFLFQEQLALVAIVGIALTALGVLLVVRKPQSTSKPRG